MTHERFFELLGTRLYGSHSVTYLDGLALVYYSLQYVGADGWVYGYQIFSKDLRFPMYGVKDNLVCMITDEEELEAFGKMAKKNGTKLFTNKLDIVIESNTFNKPKLKEKVKDRRIIFTEESFDGEKRYFYVVGESLV